MTRHNNKALLILLDVSLRKHCVIDDDFDLQQYSKYDMRNKNNKAQRLFLATRVAIRALIIGCRVDVGPRRHVSNGRSKLRHKHDSTGWIEQQQRQTDETIKSDFQSFDCCPCCRQSSTTNQPKNSRFILDHERNIIFSLKL